MSRVWRIRLLIIVFICSCSILNGSASFIITNLSKSRISRQAGYFYNKPSVSFDLPTRPQVTTGFASTVTSMAPPVATKTLSQMMYYAYPVPVGGGGESVNIGYSSPSNSMGISSTITTPSTSGYSYQAQSVTQNPTAVISAGYQSGVGSVQVSTNAEGYNYNLPQSPSIEGSVSTNAPKYLPPTNGNAPSSTTPRAYSQPLPSPTITQDGTSAPPPTLNTSYLPPNPIPTFAPTPTANVSPAVTINATPSPSYLPPIAPTQGYTPATQISISTPAPTYLPPFFSAV